VDDLAVVNDDDGCAWACRSDLHVHDRVDARRWGLGERESDQPNDEHGANPLEWAD
jgi:hypothetical protein